MRLHDLGVQLYLHSVQKWACKLQAPDPSHHQIVVVFGRETIHRGVRDYANNFD
jgi:hypothetical protein